MARRRNSILDAIDAFNSSYDTTTKVGKDIELSRIASEQVKEVAPVSDVTFSGSGDGSPAVGTAAEVSPKQFQLLGKTYNEAPTEEQANSARMMAMSGVLAKYDPMQGMRMRREVKSQDRDDKRWDRQNQQWQQEDDDRKKLKEYEEGRKDVFSSSRFGQGQNQYQQQMGEYQKKLAEYEAAKASGKTGPELGIAPVAPTRPEYSIGDSLADRAALIDHDAKYGKLDTKSFGEFTDLLNKVQSEGYEKVLRLAQSGAPIQEVAKAFNATGKVQFDPASVVSDKVVKGKDGVETRVIQYKDSQGALRTINSVAELDSLGKASDVFSRFYQSEQNRRGNEQLQLSKNADGRAGAQFAQGQADRAQDKADKKAKTEAAVSYFKQKNPNATEAELEAVRRGVIDAVPTADKNAPAEVKLANAYIAAGVAGNMAEALKMATSKSSMTPEERRADLYTKSLAATGSPEMAKKAADEGMAYLDSSSPKAVAAKAGVSPSGGSREASGRVQNTERKVGEEQTIQVGPNKGKKAVWDGQGWVLRP